MLSPKRRMPAAAAARGKPAPGSGVFLQGDVELVGADQQHHCPLLGHVAIARHDEAGEAVDQILRIQHEPVLPVVRQLDGHGVLPAVDQLHGGRRQGLPLLLAPVDEAALVGGRRLGGRGENVDHHRGLGLRLQRERQHRGPRLELRQVGLRQGELEAVESRGLGNLDLVHVGWYEANLGCPCIVGSPDEYQRGALRDMHNLAVPDVVPVRVPERVERQHRDADVGAHERVLQPLAGLPRERLLELAPHGLPELQLHVEPPLREVGLERREDLIHLLQRRHLGMRHGVEAMASGLPSRVLPQEQELQRRQTLPRVRGDADAVRDLCDLVFWHLSTVRHLRLLGVLVQLDPRFVLDVLRDHVDHGSESLLALGDDLVGHLHASGQVPGHRHHEPPVFEVGGAEDGVELLQLILHRPSGGGASRRGHRAARGRRGPRAL
mmetsp:Transcript_93971/g.265805  ORF Transcript_93971/g.265805 Transcript_93971/m.265805 type:complete len:437 (+) Transcript_93971:79-1389(+)